MKARIIDTAFVGYPAQNMARSRAFYEGILGLTVAQEFAEGWVEYQVGSTTLSLGSMESWKSAQKVGPGIAFEVDNFNDFIEHLKNNNVNFTMEPVVMESCSMAVITDPDGNLITIHSLAPSRRNS